MFLFNVYGHHNGTFIQYRSTLTSSILGIIGGGDPAKVLGFPGLNHLVIRVAQRFDLRMVFLMLVGPIM